MSGLNYVALRGYAVVFNRCGWVGEIAEIMDPHAFDTQLAAGSQRLYLNFNSHADSAISERVSLFSDSYGLGFESTVDLATWAWLCHPMRKSHCACSIGMTHRFAKPDRLADGRLAERVTSAAIDHVCITDSPAHPGTAIWAMIHSEPPPRFRELNEQWIDGRAAFLLAKRRAQVVAAHSVARQAAAAMSAHQVTRASAALVELKAARRHAQRLANLRAAGSPASPRQMAFAAFKRSARETSRR
jgi:hypothetical protein